MFVLDTDTLTLLQYGQERVTEQVRGASREVVTTDITRIEILQGRFAAVLKAEDGEKLLVARRWLDQSEIQLSRIRILLLEDSAAAEFDRLRQIKGLRRIGRPDLLIAALTLANRATLVTRNRKHFSRVPGLEIEN